MRPSNKQRSRNKSGNGGGHNNQRRNNMGNIINRVFESAGPDGKVRGTPQQIIDKYQALARDAQVAGDRVAAESYLQHSEHYSRLLGEAQRQQAELQSRFNQERDEQRGDDGQQQQRSPEAPRPEGGEGGNGFYAERRREAGPVSSGLTTIEPDDSFDLGGPIETPEDRVSRAEPAPRATDAPQPSVDAQAANGAEHQEGETPAAAPAKRPRTRRRAKAEAPAAEAVAQGE